MRILIAHQDARVRGRLRRVARSLRSNDVLVAASTQEASRRIRTWHPDLVVMSSKMADGYGEQADMGRRSHKTEAATAPPPHRPRPQRPRAGRPPGDTSLELAALLAAMDDAPTDPAQPSSNRVDREPAAPWSAVGLTDPEHEILAAVAAGSTTTELAARYGVAEVVIDGHVSDVVAKLHRLPDQR